jgi:hypothetical protein
MRWNLWRLAMLAAGGIVPLLSFFMEARVGRDVKTYLARREAAESASSAAPSTTADPTATPAPAIPTENQR